jgi:hypothetical protein
VQGRKDKNQSRKSENAKTIPFPFPFPRLPRFRDKKLVFVVFVVSHQPDALFLAGDVSFFVAGVFGGFSVGKGLCLQKDRAFVAVCPGFRATE